MKRTCQSPDRNILHVYFTRAQLYPGVANLQIKDQLCGQQSLRKKHRRRPKKNPSRSIRLDHIFNGSPAYRTACIDLSLQFQTAVVAQTHVSAGVDNSVHLLVKANGAFSIFTSRGQLRSRETGRVRWAQGGTGSSDCMRNRWRKRERESGSQSHVFKLFQKKFTIQITYVIDQT